MPIHAINRGWDNALPCREPDTRRAWRPCSTFILLLPAPPPSSGRFRTIAIVWTQLPGESFLVPLGFLGSPCVQALLRHPGGQATCIWSRTPPRMSAPHHRSEHHPTTAGVRCGGGVRTYAAGYETTCILLAAPPSRYHPHFRSQRVGLPVPECNAICFKF